MHIVFYLKREIYSYERSIGLGKLEDSLTIAIHDSDLRIVWEYINKVREMGHKLPTMHTLEHIAMDRLFNIVGKILETNGEIKNGSEKNEVYGITKIANSSTQYKGSDNKRKDV